MAVFNLDDSEQTLHYEWKDLGLEAGSYRLRDLWEQRELSPATSLTVKLRPHASILYRVEEGR